MAKLTIDQDIKDPSITGLQGLPGLNRRNAFAVDNELSSMLDQTYKQFEGELSAIRGDDPSRYREEILSNIQYSKGIGSEFVGDSRFDHKMTQERDFSDLNENRARIQSGIEQIGVGILKGAVLAGTTFTDGIIGSIAGALNVIEGGSFVANPVSTFLQDVNAWSESVLPNYYRESELENPWYKNIFTANFIGDKLLKNLGFAVGAAYSGRVNAGVLSKAIGMNKARQAFRGAVVESDQIARKSISNIMDGLQSGKYTLKPGFLMDDLAAQSKSIKNRENILKMAGSLSAGMGEARIEAIGNSEEYIKEKMDLLDQELDLAMKNEENNLLLQKDGHLYFELSKGPDGQMSMQPTMEARRIIYDKFKDKYENAAAKINMDAARIANISFVTNTALLTASDWVQFGKFYAGGYRNAKRGANIAKDATGQYIRRSSKVKDALQVVKNPFAEFNEEMLQEVTALGSGYMYDDDSYLAAEVDPQANKYTTTYLKAMSQALFDTYGDINNYEAGFLGGITGAMGVFHHSGIQGGIAQEVRDIRQQRVLDDELVSELNKSITPEMQEYYKNLVRNNYYERQKDDALDDNDEFSFKNAETSQLISNIITFDKAGRIQDLIDMVDGYGDISEQDIEDIRSQTVDKSTGKSIYDNMTDDQIIQSVKNQVDQYKDLINKYQEISSNLQVVAGKDHTSQGLDELTWMAAKIDDWESRFKTMWGEVQSGLKDVMPLFEGVEIEGIPFSQIINESPLLFLSHSLMIDPMVSRIDEAAQTELKDQEKRVENKITSSLGKGNKRGLAQMQKKLSRLQDAANISSEASIASQNISSKIGDLSRILEARANFIEKYNKYITQPEELEKKINDTVSKAQENEEKFKSNEERKESLPTTKALENAKDLNEFKQILNGFNDPDLPPEASINKRRKIADELSKKDNPLAMTYMDIYNSSKSINDIIDEDLATLPTEDGAGLIYSNREIQYAKSMLKSLSDKVQSGDELRDADNPIIDDLINEKDSDGVDIYPDKESALNAIKILRRAIQANNYNEDFKNKLIQTFQQSKEAKPTSPPNNVQQQPDKNMVSKPEVAVVEKPETVEKFPSIKDDLQAAQIPIPLNQNSIAAGGREDMSSEFKSDSKMGVASHIPEKPDKGKHKFWKPSFSEHSLIDLEKGNPITLPQRQGYEGLRGIWNLLQKEGAWEYVNRGKLKVNDQLSFRIDPNANNDPEIQGNPILIYHGEQLVGVMPESRLSDYEYLTDTINKIREEYDSFIQSSPENYNNVFASSIKTRVTEILPGRMLFSANNERDISSVKNIRNQTDQDGNPVEPTFGYVKAGVYISPNVNNAHLDSGLFDSQNKEGRLYLRIFGANGRIYPAHVTVKRFNKNEFNTDFERVQDTKTYKLLKGFINELIDATRKENDSDIVSALSNLEQIIYFDNNLKVDSIDKSGSKLMRLRFVDNNNQEISAHFVEIKSAPQRSFKITDESFSSTVEKDGVDIPNNNIISQIIDILQEYNFRFQVSGNGLNNKSYNDRLINDNLLTTELIDAIPGSAWFKMAPVKPDGTQYSNEEMGEARSAKSHHVQNNNPIGGIESVQPAVTVKFRPGRTGEEQEYGIDENGNVIGKVNNVFRGIIEDLGLIKLSLSRKPISGIDVYRTKDKKHIRLNKRGQVIWIRMYNQNELKADLSLKPIEYMPDKQSKQLEDEYRKSLAPQKEAKKEETVSQVLQKQQFNAIMAGAGLLVNPNAQTQPTKTETPPTPFIPSAQMEYEEFAKAFPYTVEAKGITQKVWDALSDQEKEHEIKCAIPF